MKRRYFYLALLVSLFAGAILRSAGGTIGETSIYILLAFKILLDVFDKK